MNLSLYNGKNNPLYETAVSDGKGIPKLKNIMTADERKEHSRVYNSSRWNRLRTLTLSENPLCIMCKDSGKLTSADTIDHCIVFKDINDPIAFDSRNLFSLCHSCHAKLYAIESKYRNIWKAEYLKGTRTIEDIAKIKYKPWVEVNNDGFYE